MKRPAEGKLPKLKRAKRYLQRIGSHVGLRSFEFELVSSREVVRTVKRPLVWSTVVHPREMMIWDRRTT